MIAAVTSPSNRGRAFGLHGSMDHAGCVIGPPLVCALVDAPVELPVKPLPFSWKALHGRLRAMIVAGLLALAAVPQVLVVLWASQAGLKIVWIPLLWAAASVVEMLVAMPTEMLSDRVGHLPLLLAGWTSRVIVFALLTASAPHEIGVWVLFLAQAFSLSPTEPAERSLVEDHASAIEGGTAFGLYHLSSGILVLPGAVSFEWLRETFGHRWAFLAAALLTTLAGVFMLTMASRDRLQK